MRPAIMPKLSWRKPPKLIRVIRSIAGHVSQKCWSTTLEALAAMQPESLNRAGLLRGVRYTERYKRGPQRTRQRRKSFKMLAGTTGLEPAASCVTGMRSNQLNYVPKLPFARGALTVGRVFAHGVASSESGSEPDAWWAVSGSNG